MNVDVPPPLQWFLDEGDNFIFEMKFGWFGSYGASPDAIYSLMQKHGYHLVEIEIYDAAAECPRCEHNMWFVLEHLVGKRVSKYPGRAGWLEMVELYWRRQADVPKTQGECLHMVPCPVHDIRTSVCGPLTGFNASIALASHQNSAKAIHFLDAVTKQMHGICGSGCTMYSSITTLQRDLRKQLGPKLC